MQDILQGNAVEQVMKTAELARDLDKAIAQGTGDVDMLRFKLRASLSLLFAPLCSEDGDMDVTAEQVLGAYVDFKSAILPDACLAETETAIDSEAMGVAGISFSFLDSYGWSQDRIDCFTQDIFRKNEGNYGIVANMPPCLQANLRECNKLGIEIEALDILDEFSWGFLLFFCGVETAMEAFRSAGFEDEAALRILMEDGTGLFDTPVYCAERIAAIKDPEVALEYFLENGCVDETFFGC